jgi:hypothetical protein
LEHIKNNCGTDSKLTKSGAGASRLRMVRREIENTNSKQKGGRSAAKYTAPQHYQGKAIRQFGL